MLRLVQQGKLDGNKSNVKFYDYLGDKKPNYAIIELCDDSLKPVAEPGDFALVAQFATPKNDDLVAYMHREHVYVHWWRQEGPVVYLSNSMAEGIPVPLAEILVIG